jgi:hypothetical protein
MTIHQPSGQLQRVVLLKMAEGKSGFTLLIRRAKPFQISQSILDLLRE